MIVIGVTLQRKSDLPEVPEQETSLPRALALFNAGRRRTARMAMIAITTSNSISVNLFFISMLSCLCCNIEIDIDTDSIF